MPNAHLWVQHGWCNSSGSLKGTVIEIVGKNVAHGDVQEEQKTNTQPVCITCKYFKEISSKKMFLFTIFTMCICLFWKYIYTEVKHTYFIAPDIELFVQRVENRNVQLSKHLSCLFDSLCKSYTTQSHMFQVNCSLPGQALAGALTMPLCGHLKSHLHLSGMWYSQWSCLSPGS